MRQLWTVAFLAGGLMLAAEGCSQVQIKRIRRKTTVAQTVSARPELLRELKIYLSPIEGVLSEWGRRMALQCMEFERVEARHVCMAQIFRISGGRVDQSVDAPFSATQTIRFRGILDKAGCIRHVHGKIDGKFKEWGIGRLTATLRRSYGTYALHFKNSYIFIDLRLHESEADLKVEHRVFSGDTKSLPPPIKPADVYSFVERELAKCPARYEVRHGLR